MPHWNAKPPHDDDEYFERMSHAISQAGLNWQVIENKWKNFQKAFSDFSIQKVSKFGEKDVNALMKNAGIVRNERKIRALIYNADQSLKVKKEFGSFRSYVDSFKGRDEKLIEDLESRFHHLGPSTARTFLYMSGVKLKPTEQERQWMKQASEEK